MGPGPSLKRRCSDRASAPAGRDETQGQETAVIHFKRWGAAALSIGLLAAAAGDAGAQSRPREVYEARLSHADHYNSNGERLRTVAGIIRQDRANFHRFGIQDPEDTDDVFFASADNRARLERMLLHSRTSRRVRNAILYEEPLVVVEVYDDDVEIYLK
jgi:hypothetical protein